MSCSTIVLGVFTVFFLCRLMPRIHRFFWRKNIRIGDQCSFPGEFRWEELPFQENVRDPGIVTRIEGDTIFVRSDDPESFIEYAIRRKDVFPPLKYYKHERCRGHELGK